MDNKGKVRSIRGVVVDFDLLKVKQAMENREKPDSVELREKYIDIRRRRNPRRNVADLVNEQKRNEEDAREKIRLSKETKNKQDEEVTVDDVTVSTENKPRTSKRRIVKRTKED